MRYGKWLRVTPDDVDRAERWFDRQGGRRRAHRAVRPADPLVRVDPGRVPPDAVRTFTLYTVIGSPVWNSTLIGAGYILRDNWEDVEPMLDVVQYVVMAAIMVAIGWFESGPAAGRPRPLRDHEATRSAIAVSATRRAIGATTADTSASRPLRS